MVRSVTAEFLSSLPAYQMLNLKVDFNREDVVSAISKMKNLTSLKLGNNVRHEAECLFSSIFDNMHHLENVRLCRNYRGKQDDGMIATLAKQNPNLSDVFFSRMSLTDAALTSLAQLQHLTDVRIDYGLDVTMAGVRTLLLGASRNIIRTFLVHGGQVDENHVTKEISLMCEERGMTFAAPHPGRREYVIHTGRDESLCKALDRRSTFPKILTHPGN